MFSRSRMFAGAVLAFVAIAGSARAGVPTTQIFVTPETLSLTSPAVGTPSATQTFTVNFAANGTQGEGALIGSFAFQGDNPADFTIVSGGSCTQNSTLLDASVNPTCTVIVRYTPSTSGNEDAQLFASCTTIGLIGGFAVNCSGSSQELGVAVGALLALIGQAPALNAKLLTLLAAVLVGSGVYYGVRRAA